MNTQRKTLQENYGPYNRPIRRIIENVESHYIPCEQQQYNNMQEMMNYFYKEKVNIYRLIIAPND